MTIRKEDLQMERVLSLQEVVLLDDDETGFDGSDDVTLISTVSSSGEVDVVASTCSIAC